MDAATIASLATAERITFMDEIVELRGGFATVEDRSGNLCFAARLRNVAANTLSPDENVDWLFGIGRHWSL